MAALSGFSYDIYNIYNIFWRVIPDKNLMPSDRLDKDSSKNFER